MEIFWGVIGIAGYLVLIFVSAGLTLSEFGVYGDEVLSTFIEDRFNVSSGGAKFAAAAIILVLWIVAIVVIAAAAQALFGEAPAREF